ncbi:hypothetical protein AC630_08035 [Bradyrhizobium sp. AS23.2]|nr:hypothetical protein AC630_08035 [Bradyrhizobium sp. AS23.2]
MGLVDACLLCERAASFLCEPGKHAVANPEPLHIPANGHDKLVAQYERKLWPIVAQAIPSGC